MESPDLGSRKQKCLERGGHRFLRQFRKKYRPEVIEHALEWRRVCHKHILSFIYLDGVRPPTQQLEKYPFGFFLWDFYNIYSDFFRTDLFTCAEHPPNFIIKFLSFSFFYYSFLICYLPQIIHCESIHFLQPSFFLIYTHVLLPKDAILGCPI